MTPWMCFRCSKCLRKLTDTYLRRHRSRHSGHTGPGLSATEERLGCSTVSSGVGSLSNRQQTPFIPLPDDLLLPPLPVPLRLQSSPGCQSPVEPVDSSLMDLSRDGPFDAYCVPSDTGNHLLISDGLPGCPYHMTSYRDETVFFCLIWTGSMIYVFFVWRLPTWLCFCTCHTPVVLWGWVYRSVAGWGRGGVSCVGHFGNVIVGWVSDSWIASCRLCRRFCFS